ncbi:MAG: type ISP restriction/modification enzyme, partial [Bacteroidia bacterium]
KYSTAQKTKVYDMYARFYRWSMDRVDNNGIIAFITNRSFIDSRTFDGFRKSIQDNFSHCYIIDTKSDVRANPKISGTGHNVFGIQTGVAIMFLIKRSEKEFNCKIQYISMEDELPKKEKLNWFKDNKISQVTFTAITPDNKNNWVGLVDNNWEEHIEIKKIFSLITPGVNTARDEWVFDTNIKALSKKVEYLIDKYNDFVEVNDKTFSPKIKWSEGLKTHLKKNKYLPKIQEDLLVRFSYRPFFSLFYYSEKMLSDRLTANHYLLFGGNLQGGNKCIVLNAAAGGQKPFSLICTKYLAPFQFFGDPTQCVSYQIYDENDNKRDNITDWGLQQFTDHYKDKKIKKEDIFNYTYAVLHNPAYRKKYELNLKREFPRLPFYKDFWQWAKWGKELMDLHINYEEVKPYKLELANSEAVVKELKKPKQEKLSIAAEAKELYLPPQAKIKVKLKADKVLGEIELDEVSVLKGIPKEAWEYKLGNRSALEWILDQYKEKKYSDPTIAEKFNTYRFADYKDKVIDLLKRVTTVSVETMMIIREMEKSSG